LKAVSRYVLAAHSASAPYCLLTLSVCFTSPANRSQVSPFPETTCRTSADHDLFTVSASTFSRRSARRTVQLRSYSSKSKQPKAQQRLQQQLQLTPRPHPPRPPSTRPCPTTPASSLISPMPSCAGCLAIGHLAPAWTVTRTSTSVSLLPSLPTRSPCCRFLQSPLRSV